MKSRQQKDTKPKGHVSPEFAKLMRQFSTLQLQFNELNHKHKQDRAELAAMQRAERHRLEQEYGKGVEVDPKPIGQQPTPRPPRKPATCHGGRRYRSRFGKPSHGKCETAKPERQHVSRRHQIEKTVGETGRIMRQMQLPRSVCQWQHGSKFNEDFWSSMAKPSEIEIPTYCTWCHEHDHDKDVCPNVYDSTSKRPYTKIE